MWKEKLLKDGTELVCCYFKKLLKPSMVGIPQLLEGGGGVLRRQGTPDPFWYYTPLFFPLHHLLLWLPALQIYLYVFYFVPLYETTYFPGVLAINFWMFNEGETRFTWCQNLEDAEGRMWCYPSDLCLSVGILKCLLVPCVCVCVPVYYVDIKRTKPCARKTWKNCYVFHTW